MLEGLYSAAAGMAAQQQRLDAVSNDVANASTAGYKRTRLAFRDLAYAAAATGNGVRAGAGAAVTDAGRTNAQGAFETTGQPLDVAITGDGYIPVRMPDGRAALTRSGALRIDEEGRLGTVTGLPLEPAIRLPRGTDLSKVHIGADGTVTADGRTAGRLRLQTVPAPEGLLSLGESLYLTTAASGAPRAAERATLTQGALEGSNVDMSEAMVDLIDAQRSYTLASRVVQTQDQLLEIANGIRR